MYILYCSLNGSLSSFPNRYTISSAMPRKSPRKGKKSNMDKGSRYPDGSPGYGESASEGEDLTDENVSTSTLLLDVEGEDSPKLMRYSTRASPKTGYIGFEASPRYHDTRSRTSPTYRDSSPVGKQPTSSPEGNRSRNTRTRVPHDSVDSHDSSPMERRQELSPDRHSTWSSSPDTSGHSSYGRHAGNLYPDLSDLSPSPRARYRTSSRNEDYRSQPPQDRYVPGSPTDYRQPPRPRPRRNNKPREQQKSSAWLEPMHVCAGCVLALLVIMAVFFFQPNNSSPVNQVDMEAVDEPKLRQDMVEHFERKLQEIRELFPGQSKRFWTVIKAAIKRVLKDPVPLQPAVILVAGPDGSRDFLLCLARKIASAVSEAYKSTETVIEHLHSTSAFNSSPDDIKLLLDNKLSSGFHNGARTAIIHNLAEIPGKSAMMFHAYCDNENAPFKDVAIMFTVELSNHSSVFSERDVEEFLQTRWTEHLDIDRVTPLLSRIGNNIAVYSKEPTEILKKAKC